MKPVKLMITGGGIGGLTAALCLHQAGFDVHIYEAARKIEPLVWVSIFCRTAGEEVDPSLYYFRSIPVFETGDIKYQRLTKNIFLATGIRKPEEVFIQVWKLM
jgi:cation diffusion facilitator CzcD-associated flavoprotein CzcO